MLQVKMVHWTHVSFPWIFLIYKSIYTIYKQRKKKVILRGIKHILLIEGSFYMYVTHVKAKRRHKLYSILSICSSIYCQTVTSNLPPWRKQEHQPCFSCRLSLLYGIVWKTSPSEQMASAGRRMKLEPGLCTPHTHFPVSTTSLFGKKKGRTKGLMGI